MRGFYFSIGVHGNLYFGKGASFFMRVFAENENVRIVFTERQDIPLVIDAEGEKENARYICQWSFEQHMDALDNPDILHLIVKNIDGKYIGYVIIKGMTNQNNSIELMRIVITNKGSGYGKSVISLIKKWCFEEQQAHRLWLDVQEDNVRAQHIYEGQGFKREGILRECIKVDQVYKSLVVMAILSQEHRAED